MPKKANIVLEKADGFALEIVKLYQYLTEKKHEYILSKQILRSGTSIGANLHEAQAGYSKREFCAIVHIAAKEARETHYWLRLLIDSGYLDSKSPRTHFLEQAIEEIIALLTSIVKTSQKNLNKC